jgi:peptidoglycan/xylan/chitin deacetylase (PgdA/CDA1 family)
MDLSTSILIYDPQDRKKFSFDEYKFKAAGVQTLEVDYARIGRDPKFTDELRQLHPKALIFTHNEDMSQHPKIGLLLGAIKAGYTCLSGIDPEFEVDQTKQCLNDFLHKTNEIHIPEIEPRDVFTDRQNGTFTFVFDFEQFGGARYGLPRIIPLLETNGIRATFFVTGFVSHFYPELIERLRKGGHEIALHGPFHEFLSGMNLKAQTDCLLDQQKSLGSANITGANFIYRMDNNSPTAMAQAGLNYFVLFRKSVFYRTRFLEISTKIRTIKTNSQPINMIPIGIETYAVPKIELKGTIDTSFRIAQKEQTRHITILMHPFKDGMLSRLPQLKWLIHYVKEELQLRSVTLNQLPSQPNLYEKTNTCIYYPILREPARLPENKIQSLWWIPEIYHHHRIERLADQLEHFSPNVMTTSPDQCNSSLAVFPSENLSKIEYEPLVPRKHSLKKLASEVQVKKHMHVRPPWLLRDTAHFIIFHVPRRFIELKVLIRRLFAKLSKIKIVKEL